MTIITTEREQQRFDHLVLGRPRPAPAIGAKPKGLSKAEWRARKEQLRTAGRTLLPGIEERVQLHEAHGGRRGTPETIAQLEARQPGRARSRACTPRARSTRTSWRRPTRSRRPTARSPPTRR